MVVGDDLCTGSRYFTGLIDDKAILSTAIAATIPGAGRLPGEASGALGAGGESRAFGPGKTGTGGDLFLLKFCDPHAFDYPYLKEALEKAGIPSMVLEVEDRLPAEGQLRTRFEAFLEMMNRSRPMAEKDEAKEKRKIKAVAG